MCRIHHRAENKAVRKCLSTAELLHTAAARLRQSQKRKWGWQSIGNLIDFSSRFFHQQALYYCLFAGVTWEEEWSSSAHKLDVCVIIQQLRHTNTALAPSERTRGAWFMSAQHGADVTLSLIVGFYTRIRAKLNSFPLTDFFKSTTATTLLVESLSSSYSPLCTDKYFTKQPSWLLVKRSWWMGWYSRSVRKSLCLMFNLSFGCNI